MVVGTLAGGPADATNPEPESAPHTVATTASSDAKVWLALAFSSIVSRRGPGSGGMARAVSYIDEPNVARVPKRTDMFARAQFGDMGPALQKGATAGHYVRKAAPSSAQRRLLGAFVLLQDGEPAAHAQQIAPELAADTPANRASQIM